MHHLLRTERTERDSLAILSLEVAGERFCCNPEYDRHGVAKVIYLTAVVGNYYGAPNTKAPPPSLQRSLQLLLEEEENLVVGDVLRALPSFPAKAAKHSLTSTVTLLFAGTTEVS